MSAPQTYKRTKHSDYGQRWEIAAFLQNGPKNAAQITEHYLSYLRFLGLYAIQLRIVDGVFSHLDQRVQESLNELIKEGWVLQDGEMYHLTEKGSKQADIVIQDMHRTKKLIDTASNPFTVSKVSTVCHLLLAVLKLTAAILSGSVGLLNDGIDTLMDGLSSILVFLGLKFKKERLVNGILVLFMLGSGGFALYEAVRRIFQPANPEANTLAIVAMAVSMLVCLLLGFYQRYIGLKRGVMVLITQSVDSRNHVIIGAGVILGLIATSFGFPLLDTLIGLLIAVLILKSTVELLIEFIHEMQGQEPNLSEYRMAVVEGYEKMRCSQLSEWMLYMVGHKHVEDWGELRSKAEKTLDISENTMLQELGLARSRECVENIDQALAFAVQKDWLLEQDGKLSVTSTGRAFLDKKLNAFQNSHLMINEGS